MINTLKDLFPQNPFAGGLGNRQNDAIAYYHGGMSMDKIFFVDKSSKVQQMDKVDTFTTYEEMKNQIELYFPSYSAPKVGYQ